MLERLSGDSDGKSMQMTLGCRMCLGQLLPIRTVFPLLLGVRCFFQPHLRLFLYAWWGLCLPEVSLRYLSNLILYFIHSDIVIIYIIPLFQHLYYLQFFLDTLETNTTLMVAPIIMMMMLRKSAMNNSGSRRALAMMRLSVKLTA